MSRPSCLGEKSRRPEELLREPGLDAGPPSAGGVTEAWPGLLEKAPVPVENGWSPGPRAARSRPGSPVLRRSQSEVAVQNGGAAGAPLRGQAGGAAWTPPRAGVPRSAWSWKPVTTREVTEVTEVTETIVTEIVEVTEYPAGEKGGEPVVTRTVTVLTECVGELTAAACAGHTDAAEVTDGERASLGGPCATGLPSGVIFSSASLDLRIPWPGLVWSRCLCPGAPRAGHPGQGIPFPQLWLGLVGVWRDPNGSGCAASALGSPVRDTREDPTGWTGSHCHWCYLGETTQCGGCCPAPWLPSTCPHGRLSHLSPQVSSRAVPVPEEAAERGQETLERLLAWVADMEELVSNQKPPSAEAKVVKAQLEEQKVSGAGRRVPPTRALPGVPVAVTRQERCTGVPSTAQCPPSPQLLKRLLEERRPRVELVLQDRLTAQGSGSATPEGSAGLCSLEERWDKLMQEAEARWVRGQALITGLASRSCWHGLCPLVFPTRNLCDTLVSPCSAPLSLGPP